MVTPSVSGRRSFRQSFRRRKTGSEATPRVPVRLAVLGGETGQAGFPLAGGVPGTRGFVFRRLRALAAGNDPRDQDEESSQQESSDQFHNEPSSAGVTKQEHRADGHAG